MILTTSTSGAVVTVDGHDAGVTPLPRPVELRPGAHTVHLKKPGYLDYNENFLINADVSTPLYVQMQKLEPGAGNLDLVPLPLTPSQPHASVAAAALILNPPLGAMTQPGDQLMQVNPLDPPVQAEATLHSDAWYNQWWVWTGAGAVLAAGAGVLTYEVVHSRNASNSGLQPNASWHLGNPVTPSGIHGAF